MPHVLNAFKWFEANWDVFKDLDLKSMLYVGWTKSTKDWWREDFCDELGIEEVTVIDIFDRNVQAARNALSGIKVIHGDISKVDKHVGKGEYDLIFWDHGPEHAEESSLTDTLNLLKDWAGKCVVCACPWGNFPQGKIYGNEWEEHKFDVLPEHFDPSGYTVITINTVNRTTPTGELIAYYKKGK